MPPYLQPTSRRGGGGGGVTARICAKPAPSHRTRCCACTNHQHTNKIDNNSCRSTVHSTRTSTKHSQSRSADRGSLAIVSLRHFPAWCSPLLCLFSSSYFPLHSWTCFRSIPKSFAAFANAKPVLHACSMHRCA